MAGSGRQAGGRRRLNSAACVRRGRCRKPPPPTTWRLHVAWHVHVHAGVAVPAGTLSKLQHNPAPSRMRNPLAMRAGLVVGCARGPDGCLGMAVRSPASVVHPCFSQATKMLACEPRVLVVSRRVRDACRRVAECRSGGLGSGRKPVASMCVSNARPSCSLHVLRRVRVASIAYTSISIGDIASLVYVAEVEARGRGLSARKSCYREDFKLLSSSAKGVADKAFLSPPKESPLRPDISPSM